jgi:hypothetical protein
VEGFGLEGRAVGGDEEPVVNFVAEELDAAEGGKSRRRVGSWGIVVSGRTSQRPLSRTEVACSRSMRMRRLPE